jgi:hypothetical protein
MIVSKDFCVASLTGVAPLVANTVYTQAQQVVQILEGAPQEFSTLAWSLNGQWLAAGGQQGEWLVWQQSVRGKGFG